ncbi:MAG: hypothetical protein K2Y08_04190 [Alphaproteobacteria bacterium]|nr:hypothetical protein [Alphaproteobacteria bacterium]
MQTKLFQILIIAAFISVGFEQARAEGPQIKSLYKKSNCQNRCTYILNDGAEVALTPQSLETITAALASNIKKESNDRYSSQVTVNGETISLEYERVKE